MINPLTGSLISGAVSPSQTQRTSARILQAVTQLASGKAQGDVSDISQAAMLQERLGGLRSASQNLAMLGSQLQTADQALGQQSDIISRMQVLATQANSGALDKDSRKALQTEFSALTQELTRISQTTGFGSQKLLDGTFTANLSQALGDDAPLESASLSIPGTAGEDLFSTAPDISSQEGAAQAIAALQEASQKITAARADAGSFAEAADYASAGIQSALFNQQAALSVLDDADFTTAATALSQDSLKQSFELATKAQTLRLAPSMLELIQN